LIRARVYVKEIDYNMVLDMAMSYVNKGHSENDGEKRNPFSRTISRLEKPSKLKEFLISVVPGKDNIAAYLFNRNDQVIKEALNDVLMKNKIAANINNLDIEVVKGVNKMLKFEVTIDQIDYVQTVENLTPLLLQKMAEQDNKAGRVAQMLLSRQELPSNVLKAAIGAIPEDQRDELLTDILMEYKEELVGTLNSIVTKNNMKAEISQLKIDNQ